MDSVYKVTATGIGETKKGYKVYRVQLNNSLWVTKLFPFRKLERKYDKLHKLYEEKNNLDFMVGKYISISLNQSQYGVEFSSINSFDVIQEFKDLLDSSKGKAFSTWTDVYGFLKKNNYSINHDNSITLKDPYANFNIMDKNGITVCYPNHLGDKCLTIDNIEAIFNQFYNGKEINNGNPDRDSKYALTPTAIVEDRTIYHKSKSQTSSHDTFDVIRIGDRLSESQYNYTLSL
ncbi:MAG: hypothetical protein OCD00_10440 [Colwellia sp.]